MEQKIPLVAVLGHPIHHSKSPKLHNFWLNKYGIKGYYIPIDVAPGQMKNAIKNMQDLGFVGANVTLPHKETALEISDIQSTAAIKIGAANTLTFQSDGQIIADNTDAYGILENISEQYPNHDISQGPALVIGAGGAARAILFALRQKKCAKIYLTNRTKSRAELLSKMYLDHIEVVDWNDKILTLPKIHTLINTSSLGMVGHEQLDLDLSTISQTTLVTDIVYTPLETKLLKNAAMHGCKTVDGLGMLLHQAVPGFQSWFGKKPQVTQELRDYILS